MKRSRVGLAASVIAGLLAGAAFAADALVERSGSLTAARTTAPTRTADAPRVAPAPRPAARPAPDFTALTIEGTSFRLSAYRGRVVVLEFLLPGCPECVRDARPLERVAARYASRRVKAVIVDISGASARLLRDYYRGQIGLRRVVVVRDKPFSFKIARAYGVTLPGMTFVIGRDGSITWQGAWSGRASRLHAAIEAALE